MAPAPENRDPISEAILRTQIGLIVLAIGVVLAVVTQFAVFGGFAGLAGVGLLISGRAPFGRLHGRLLILGLALGIAGDAGSSFLVLTFPQSIGSPPAAGMDVVPWLQALAASVSRYLLAITAFSVVSSLGVLLYTYALQARLGRALLWIGIGLNAVINLTIWYVISQEFDLLVQRVASGSPLNQATLAAISAHLQQFALLSLIPASIFAGCFYLASDRIRSGAVTAARPARVSTEPPAGGTR